MNLKDLVKGKMWELLKKNSLAAGNSCIRPKKSQRIAQRPFVIGLDCARNELGKFQTELTECFLQGKSYP